MDKVLEFCRKYGLGLFVLSIVLILLLPHIMKLCGPDFLDLSQESYSHIGDAFGGITGPFIAIIAAFLTFIAFWVQYKFNKEQSRNISRERFEHNFYEMLSLHEDITNGLSLDIVSRTTITDDNGNSLNVSNVVKSSKGRDVFEMMYLEYPFMIEASSLLNNGGSPIARNYVGLEDFFTRENTALELYVNLSFVGKLDHYFRQSYRVLKYIKDYDESVLNKGEKYYYASIFRSLFSQYELVLLYYNCLSDVGYERFKPLIEDYAFFNNLRPELLATDKEKNYYLALKNNVEALPERPYERVYERKAFVKQ